ncbi:RDD family protein [Lysinibacillus sp. UGB7]|uniref:RDD family protein n=1 Tax=Lysinibacillus sp. UGB7 TaxID=3411039 RepID=UPI003B7A6B38
MEHEQNVNFSGFWTRFLAYLIDGIVLGLVYIPIVVVSGIIQVVLSISLGEESILGVAIATWIIASIIYLAVGLAYMILMPASKYQGTVGKKLMGIKIVDEDGGRISVSKSVLRYLGMIVSGLTFYIGYIMIAFHPQKRALHDIIGGTYVVSAK